MPKYAYDCLPSVLEVLARISMTKENEMVHSRTTDIHSEGRQSLDTSQWHLPRIYPRATEAISFDSQKNSTSYPLPKLSLGEGLGAIVNTEAFFKRHIEASKGSHPPTEKSAGGDCPGIP